MTQPRFFMILTTDEAYLWLHGLTVAGAAKIPTPARQFLVDTGLADVLEGAAADFQVA